MEIRNGKNPTHRQVQIVDATKANGTIRIGNLAQTLGVSLETIRRDIRPLVEAGILLKHHGSVSVALAGPEAPFERRLRENAAVKLAIARKTTDLIDDGDSVMLDTGATTSILARELLRKSTLTIVTNSSDIARTLATVSGNKVYMAGGEFHGDNGATFGRSAIEFVANFSVQHSIISIAAIDAETGLMDHQLAEAEFARTVLRCGQRRTVITDHTKFSQTALVNVCGFDDFDVLVTDQPPPSQILRRLHLAGVECQIAEEITSDTAKRAVA